MNFNENGMTEDLNNYIYSLFPPMSTRLEKIEIEAKNEGLPIVRPLSARFLYTLMEICKPKKVLEIGCLIGYSTSIMGLSLEEDGKIVTIDRYSDMLPRARKNFQTLGIEDKITILEGDALDILPTLNETFDLIFVDAAKGKYNYFFAEALRLSHKGTILIFDDIFQKGNISKDFHEIEKRQRTIYNNMRKFIYNFLQEKRLKSTVLPIGDGMAFGVVVTD